MRPYQYRNLRPGEIRLLRLHPAPDPDRDLSGSLVHHELTNPTVRHGPEGQFLEYSLPYEAVSYHWGSNTKTPFNLVVRDDAADDSTTASVIPLTAALHTLLRQIAYPDKGRVVWVDAICINQVLSTANVEKGGQIRLMPDIYRTASRTIVYLGPASHDSDLAISFLEHLSEYSELLDEQEPGASFDASVAAGFVMPAPDGPELEAVRSFWCRSWFRRVWIIQEFVYASDLLVLCGPREVDWRRLWLAAKPYVSNPRLSHAGFPKLSALPLMLLSQRYTRRRGDLWRGPHEGARALQAVADMRLRCLGYMSSAYMIFALGERSARDRWRPGLPVRRDFDALVEYEDFARPRTMELRARGTVFLSGKGGLLALLDASKGFMATQPVDRIYALLGLAADVDGEEFAPRYEEGQTLAAVSTRVAAGLVRQGRGAQVLPLARMGEQRGDGTPSWVPNWTSVVNSEDRRLVFGRPVGGRIEKDIRAEQAADAERRAEKRRGHEPGHGAQEHGDAETKEGAGEDQTTEKQDIEVLRFYKACGDTKFHHRIDEARGLLYVKASPVDEVAGLLKGRMMMGTHVHDSLIRPAYPNGTYPTGEPIEEVLWRTQMANLTVDHKVPGPEYAAMYRIVLTRDRHVFNLLACAVLAACAAASPLVLALVRFLPPWTLLLGLAAAYFLRPRLLPSAGVAGSLGVLLPILRWLRWLYALPVLLFAVYRALTNVYYNEVIAAVTYLGGCSAAAPGLVEPEAALYMGCLARVANKYSLGLTRAGRLLCLFPPEAEPGDVVFLVDGCDAPFVLRRGETPGMWRVVGECYVHGVMNGEAAGRLPVTEEIGLY
ncbi:ankyrin and het domain protein [Colletotrichum plurivorum]|uniref:Ankyrin and het domain protein n=1 Tax=Colletotrichum plurivorum TaxID=2175906 RepID=A0A8H6KA71_9PEZI|nr:ankyrin and het domain protein [Colletotrichum plurivorum]